MVELGQPLWLALWLLLPLVARPLRARLRWSSVEVLGGPRTLRLRTAWLPEALQLAGLAALVLALARPQVHHREVVVSGEGIDIQLALDVSGSMDALDFEIQGQSASRLEVAKAVVSEFVAGRPMDRVGLGLFGEVAFTQVPLTTDTRSLQRFIGQVALGAAGRNGTAIGDGLAVAAAPLARLDAPSKVIVLLTDGHSNAGELSPLEAAEVAQALGIRVYTIGVGATDGGGGGLFGMLRGAREEIDEPTLRAVAERTQGQYFRATDTASLRRIYATIDGLEKSTAEVVEIDHAEELYRWALVPGLALWVLGQLLGATVWRTLP